MVSQACCSSLNASLNFFLPKAHNSHWTLIFVYLINRSSLFNFFCFLLEILEICMSTLIKAVLLSSYWINTTHLLLFHFPPHLKWSGEAEGGGIIFLCSVRSQGPLVFVAFFSKWPLCLFFSAQRFLPFPFLCVTNICPRISYSSRVFALQKVHLRTIVVEWLSTLWFPSNSFN